MIRMTGRPRPTVDDLRKWFEYDRTTGIITRKVRRGQTGRIGDIAGSVGLDKNGRLRRNIEINRKVIPAADIAWAIATGSWPSEGTEIDHINSDPLDNSFGNLRIATRSQNQANRGPNKNNLLGVKGVSRIKNRRGGYSYKAEIACNRTRIYLGRFDDCASAAAAYAEKAKELFGEFARTEW